MANSDYVLSATLELKDKLTGKLNDARKGLEGMKGSAAAASGALDRVGTSAVKAAADTGRLKSALSSVKGSYQATVGVKDEASGRLGVIKSSVKELAGRASAVTVRARDEASGKITHIREELAGLSGKMYTAMVNVKRNTGGAPGLAEKAGGAVSGVASGMLMNTSMQMAGAAGIGFGIYDAIKSYADFEKEMSAVKAISGATGAEFDMLTEKARQMGADTKFSATESAQAFEYMAMAGWKTDDMMNGIEGVMNLAAASGEDLGRVSDIVTDALTAFGLKASDSAHFADVLAAAATSSNTNVGMMGETFKYVAPLAGALKYDVEDVATAIGVMANSGVKGTEAGTSLRSIFTRLAKPPKDAAEALDALGISIKNSDGTIKPFMQTMEEMRDKFSTLSDDQKVQYAASIAGQEAMSGLLAIMNASEGDFKKVANAIDHADGAADKMAKTRMDNLAGDIELVGGAWDQFIQTIMKGGVSGGLRSVVQEAGSAMDFLNERIKDGLDFGDVFALAGKLVTDLKNKFIEFDGVGSLLAGGALAAGFYKVIGLAKKAVSAVKDLAGMRKGGVAAGAATSAVGEMVVNAATVVVNGRSIAGGAGAGGKTSGGLIYGPDGRPIKSDRVPSPAPQPARGPTLRANAKMLGGAGALAAIFGAMDVYSAHSQNSTLMEEAVWGVKQASENIEELTKNVGSQEQWQSALDEYTKANDYRAQVEHDNRMREGDAIGGALGSTVGTVLGGAIGSFAGPAGTMIGMTAGGILGEIAGKRIGSWLADYNVQNTVSFEKIAQWLNPKEKGPIGFDISGKTVPVDIVGDSIGIKDSTRDTDQPFGIQTDLSAIAPHAFDAPRDTSQDFGIEDMQSMYTSGMFGGVQEEAQEAASASADAFSAASASISTDFANTGAAANVAADDIQMDMLGSAQGSQDTWSPFPSWYDASVAVPTADAASECGVGVSDSFVTSAADTQSAWSGVGSFFSGLFASIKSGAASAAASVAASMSHAAASAREGGHTNVAAVLDFGTQVFDWGAGTNYSGKRWASGTSFAPGGWSEINEHGGEIVDLPTGARVYPHATTLSMLKHTFEDNLPTAIPVSAPSVSVDLPRARSDAGAPQVVITGNSFIVREEADMDKIAYKLMQLMQQAKSNMNPVEGVLT